LTALHAVTVANQTSDLVEYLCGKSVAGDEMLLQKDRNGKTVLHYAANKKIARLLIDSVSPERKAEFVFSMDADQNTVLHNAALYNRTDVVMFLCSLPLLNNEFVFLANKFGRTALHYTQNKESAKAIVDSVTPPARQRDLLLLRDKDKYTALHYAATSWYKQDLVEYFCSISLAKF